jgi:hypothetical protein
MARKYPTHLVIPDSHAKHDQDLRRYTALGNFIAEHQPNVIVNIGDHADMPSGSHYDVGKKSFEGRRYKLDIAAAIEANKLLFAPFKGIKGYKPRTIMTLGNHEHRINKMVENDAKMDGVIHIDDLEYKRFYGEVYPFLKPVEVDGVLYAHYFVSGVMGKPIGGMHQAANMIKKTMKSCTMGHTHILHFAKETTPDGRKVYGLVAGCFFEHDEDYAGVVPNRMYDRGFVMKHEVREGQYDFEWISIERLIKNYL